MKTFDDYLQTIFEEQHRKQMQEILDWITTKFPSLTQHIGWKQPMFLNQGTYIIGFSAAKKHISVAPEQQCMEQFLEEIKSAGYSQTRRLFRIPWDSNIDYPLLQRIINFNIQEKAGYPDFWRK